MFGVIVAAGYGSRFLPLTKTMPKEMLPLFDKPCIDFILDEFEEAGIKDVIIITSRRKKVLDDYLDREVELESVLEKDGKTKLLDAIKPRSMNFIFLRQQRMLGTGHAILQTKNIIGKSPFIVAYPDDIVLSKPSLSKSLIKLHQKTGLNILAVREERENPSRYGVISPREKDGLLYMDKIVEKPPKESAPSHLVSIGRYCFTSELLDLLEAHYQKHQTGEFYHIDSINQLASAGKVLALPIEGTMLDTGEPASFLKSTLVYLKSRADTAAILDEFVRENYSKI